MRPICNINYFKRNSVLICSNLISLEKHTRKRNIWFHIQCVKVIYMYVEVWQFKMCVNCLSAISKRQQTANHLNTLILIKKRQFIPQQVKWQERKLDCDQQIILFLNRDKFVSRPKTTTFILAVENKQTSIISLFGTLWTCFIVYWFVSVKVLEIFCQLQLNHCIKFAIVNLV